MKRREFTASIVSASMLTISGCASESNGSGVETPNREKNPRELIPNAPDGWSRGEIQQQSAGLIGAEAGFGASYYDPNGTHYAVEIYRWGATAEGIEKAEENADYFKSNGWPVYVIIGNFIFAGKGPDVDKVRNLLSNSPALTLSYIEEHEM